MTNSEESVAVVVVTFNSASVLPGFIHSLDAGFGSVRWNLYAADNNSIDNSVELLRRLAPDATIIEMGRNSGYAAGINAAVAVATSYSAILVLNPDVRLHFDSVPELLTALRHSGTGIAVPRLSDAGGKLIESMRREPTIIRACGDLFLGARRAGKIPLLGEMVTDDRLYERETVADWAEGSTQLISAQCWRDCGPWDDSYFLYSEETDFDLRAGDAGYRLRFAPSAGATHLEGGSASTPGLWALVAMNRVRLFRRRNGLLRAAPFWLATVLRELSRALLGKATSRAAVRALISPARMRERPGPHSIRGR